MKMKKVFNLLLFVLCGAFFMIAALGSSSKDSYDGSKYDTSKIYKVGDTLDCPYFDVSIDRVDIKKKGTSIDSYQVINDAEWIGVILTVKNKSSESRTFYGSNVDLINSNGEVLDHSWMTYKIWGVEMLNSPELISGGFKTGYIQYANNTDDNSKLTLRVKCPADLFDDNVTYNVDISQ